MLVAGAVDVAGLVMPPAVPEEMTSTIDVTGAVGDKTSTTPDDASLDTRETALDEPADRADVVPTVQDGNGANAADAPEDPVCGTVTDLSSEKPILFSSASL